MSMDPLSPARVALRKKIMQAPEAPKWSLEAWKCETAIQCDLVVTRV